MIPSPTGRRSASRHGFTLLEVLMAVAVIAILMGIIIPALGGAQNSAKRAKTRAQFAQWSTAIEQFRQEYGYYPDFSTAGGTPSSNNFSDGQISSAARTTRFVQTLSGRDQTDGTLLTSSDPGYFAGNRKSISFCSFGSSDLTSAGELQDAFGNLNVVVLMDRNLDGLIFPNTANDFPAAGAPSTLTSSSGETVTIPISSTVPIRAGVAFYSAGDGRTPVTSW